MILKGFVFFSQTKSLKFSVYFDNDKAVLRKESKVLLTKMSDSIKKLDVKSIYTFGNTDNNADSLYNVKLSFKRTESVSKFLISQGINENLFTKKFFGEEKPLSSNETDDGKQKNRRVDIMVVYQIKKVIPIKVDSIPLKIVEVEKVVPIIIIDPCSKDTVISLPNGTLLVFNLCEYLENKDCLDISETLNSADARSQGLTTLDAFGNPLVSCGMVGVEPKAGCETICFKKPVLIKLPFFEKAECNPCGRTPILYDIDKNGNWVISKTKIKVVKVDGKEYYQYDIPCTSKKKNCDCPKPKIKFKIKTKRKFKIINVTVSSDCPLAAYTFKPNKKRKNVVRKKHVTCSIGKGDVSAYVQNRRTKEYFVLTQRPLSSLPKFIWFARCRQKNDTIIEKKIIGIFPFKKRLLYRKYKFYTKHLTKKD